MTERLKVPVSFNPACGFVSEASHKVPRSIAAASLDELRRRIYVLILSRRGRRDRPVTLMLDLDPAAAQEAQRRRAGKVALRLRVGSPCTCAEAGPPDRQHQGSDFFHTSMLRSPLPLVR